MFFALLRGYTPLGRRCRWRLKHFKETHLDPGGRVAAAVSWVPPRSKCSENHPTRPILVPNWRAAKEAGIKPFAFAATNDEVAPKPAIHSRRKLRAGSARSALPRPPATSNGGRRREERSILSRSR